jgi:hypothetical protein
MFAARRSYFSFSHGGHLLLQGQPEVDRSWPDVFSVSMAIPVSYCVALLSILHLVLA